MSVAAPMTLNGFPAKLKPPALSCVNEPSKLDPCPTACYVLVLPKEQGKETRALQEKILPWRLKTIWQRKDVWKTLFQNKSSGTINPAYLPLELLNNTKNVSINKTLSITNFAHDFYPAAWKEHQMNNCDPDRVLFWKTCNEHLELTREALPFAHPDGVIFGGVILLK